MRYSLPFPTSIKCLHLPCKMRVQQRYLGSGPQREGNVCARSGLLKNSKGAVLLFLVFTSVFFWGRDCDLCIVIHGEGEGGDPPPSTHFLFNSVRTFQNPYAL